MKSPGKLGISRKRTENMKLILKKIGCEDGRWRELA
jgi:hypothetical protein